MAPPSPSTDTVTLLQKYQSINNEDPSTSVDFKEQLKKIKPDWDKLLPAGSSFLQLLELDAPPLQQKSIIQSHRQIMKHSMDALQIQDTPALQWLLTVFWDMLRDDSSCFSLFEFAAKSQVAIFSSFMKLLGRNDLDKYVADRAAWILSAIIGNAPTCFNDAEVKELLALAGPGSTVLSPLGSLDTVVNLLKADIYRGTVYRHPHVADTILKVQVKSAAAPYLYRCAFAIWMLSYDQAIVEELRNEKLVDLLKEFLVSSRVEKVIRLTLTVVRNLITYKGISEDIVEGHILDAVTQLEYEKWRDSELYDTIQDVAQQINARVSEVSSFARYEQELNSGCLSWGFIHSEKFWKENIKNFETDNFKAVKLLCTLLHHDDSDLETIAVACHDLGQFVALHPLGKKIVSQYQVKDRIMDLMSSNETEKREIRREALLCCQKIMLNQWQQIS